MIHKSDKIDALSSVSKFLTQQRFKRKGLTWNRQRNPFIDVVAFGVNKNGEKFTASAGVFDSEVYRIVWEKQSPKFIEEPYCQVRIRIGEFLNGTDLWWSMLAKDTEINVENATRNLLLPYIESISDRTKLYDQILRQSDPLKSIPVTRIHKAVTSYLIGNQDFSLAELLRIKEDVNGAWSDRIVQIMKNFKRI